MRGEEKNPKPDDETEEVELLDEDLSMPWEKPGALGSGGDSKVAKGIYDILGDEGEFAEEKIKEPSAEDDDEKKSAESDDEDDEDDDPVEDDDSEDDLDDEEEDDEDDDKGVEEEVEIDEDMVFEVKVDGKAEEVTLRDALDGYQRQSDYTRKTQEVATERKALADDLTQTRAVREALGQQLVILEQALSDEGTPPDWEKLRAEDPQKFANEYAAHQLRQEKLGQVKAAREKLAEDQAADDQKVLSARLIDERNKLSEVIPEFKDDAKAKAGMEAIRAYIANTYGADDDELNAIVDHRFVLMALKAMRYDRAKAKGNEKVRGKKKKGGRVLSPGAKPAGSTSKKGKKSKGKVKAYKRARTRLGQSGRVEDAAAALLAMEDE